MLTSEEIVLDSPQGKLSMTCVMGQGTGLVDFSVFPHLDNEDHPDASLANVESWVARLPGPTYAIDDQTAVKVTDKTVEVVSEGHWKLITH